MNRRLFAALAFPAILGCFLGMLIGCKKTQDLEYPGNGIAILSKNRPITFLNMEMRTVANSMSGFQGSSEGIQFDQAPYFRYDSTKPFIGHELCFKLPINLSAGKCSLQLSSLGITVTPDSLLFAEDGVPLREFSPFHTTALIVEKWASSTTVRADSNSRVTGPIPFHLALPATVSLEIAAGSSGTIGPWLWLRGYE